MAKIELVALDVDGTLIDDHYRITDRTGQAVRQAYERGVRIVLCTGRGPVSTLPLIEELGLTGIAITHNGAATIDSASKAVLHEFAFGMPEVAGFVEYCRSNEIHFDVNTAFELYVDHVPADMRQMYENYLAEPVVIGDVMQLDEPIVKISVCADSSVLDQLMEQWPAVGNAALRIIRSGDNFVDVMHKDACKGAALRSLGEHLGIPAERMLAIGNYYNDIEMLEYAGIGIAMDNSPEEVKKRADAVTASNNDDGVYHALVKYGILEA